MSEMYEGIVFRSDEPSARAAFGALSSPLRLRLVRLAPDVFGVYRDAGRADRFDPPALERVAQQLSTKVGQVVALFYDNRCDIESGVMYDDGRRTCEFGEADGEWVPYAPGSGEPLVDGPRFHIGELQPDQEYDCVFSAIGAALSALGAPPDVTDADVKQAFCYGEPGWLAASRKYSSGVCFDKQQSAPRAGGAVRRTGRGQAMRRWGCPVPPEELIAVGRAEDAFRELWASIRPPWPAAFDGTSADVRAIDYLHYEGLEFPKCGIEGAALVCGEVLRRAAQLEWAISYRGEWLVATPEYEWPAVAICPLERVALPCSVLFVSATRRASPPAKRGRYTVLQTALARLHELECGAGPQDGKYTWFLHQAALECMFLLGPDPEPGLRQLFGSGAGLSGYGEYVRHIEHSIRHLRQPARST